MKRFAFLWMCLLSLVPALAQQDEWNENTEIATDLMATDQLPITLQWPRNVQGRIDQIVQDPVLDRSQMGMLVWDLTADSAIYRYYDQLLLRPASTMKLVTAITAIDRLGGEYHFVTSLYYKGVITDRTLVGDVYVVGGMDPMLDDSDLQTFARELHQLGIDSISGRLVADVSMKDTLRWGEGWCWDDENPVLSPLTLGRDTHFMERFAQTLATEDIAADSIVIASGTKPNDALVVCVRRHSLDQVLMKMMKDSDNFFAESVLYQTAASMGHKPAQASDGMTATRRLINSLGLNGHDYRLADGSGLSLYNYVSPELLVRLLRFSWRNQRVYQHLLPSLPVAGQDGTLKTRMRRSAAAGNVRAKTGTLTGISSLAGYCIAANGHELCFAIINQGILNAREGKSIQDRICNALCRP